MDLNGWHQYGSGVPKLGGPVHGPEFDISLQVHWSMGMCYYANEAPSLVISLRYNRSLLSLV